MALRNIVEQGDPCLNKVCRPVTEFNRRLHTLLDDMLDTLAEANGAGLAAPQVGVLRRVCIVMDDESEEYLELINPEIIAVEGEQIGTEGCLSSPGEYGVVTRPMTVTVRAMNRKGETVTYTGSELLARAFCHEIDHLDGVLFKDKASKMLAAEEMKRRK